MPSDQTLGARKAYEYENDQGGKWLVTLDETLGNLSACGLSAATHDTTAVPKPVRAKPRHVWWESDDGIYRKKLTCNPEASAYKSNISTAITIAGIAGKTTGRVGEKLSFQRFAPLVP